ncbi:MAG TPA: OsmC family protein [Tepidisphaeraceae bacterium]|nr:OsmC family protein [Tepidisphaeraceae bacterium]
MSTATQSTVRPSTPATPDTARSPINGIDVAALRQTIEAVRAAPAGGQTRWAVDTDWLGGTQSRTRVAGCELGGQWVDRPFEFVTDEPTQLLGTNTAPNPQEYLLGALNACMTVGYVAGASLYGVKLESLRIRSEGSIDLRGFLGISRAVPAGYDKIRYTVHIKGDGTPEQMRKIHELVMATSPNRFNLANPIALEAELVVE